MHIYTALYAFKQTHTPLLCVQMWLGLCGLDNRCTFTTGGSYRDQGKLAFIKHKLTDGIVYGCQFIVVE